MISFGNPSIPMPPTNMANPLPLTLFHPNPLSGDYFFFFILASPVSFMFLHMVSRGLVPSRT